MKPEAIIAHYGLEPLDQEGGYFKQVWRSPLRIDNERLGSAYPAGGTHPLGTRIHFLITADTFSAMHRLPSEEHWLHHFGDPIEMLLLHADGSGKMIEIGPDIASGQEVAVTTPPQAWQGARVKPVEDGCGYAFGSCVMVPGFEWTDFELGDRAELTNAYPEFAAAIAARTRLTAFKGRL